MMLIRVHSESLSMQICSRLKLILQIFRLWIKKKMKSISMYNENCPISLLQKTL